MKKIITTLVLLASLGVFAESVNLKKSSFSWSATKAVGGGHTGTIKMKKATFNGKTGEFVADIKSIDEVELTGDLKKKFLSHMNSSDFFDVEKYPTAKLKINKVDDGQFYGMLTVKGKTHYISMPYVKKGNVYSGQMAFDRTRFDMIYGSGNFFKSLGDRVINDTIKVNFKLVTE